MTPVETVKQLTSSLFYHKGCELHFWVHCNECWWKSACHDNKIQEFRNSSITPNTYTYSICAILSETKTKKGQVHNTSRDLPITTHPPRQISDGEGRNFDVALHLRCELSQVLGIWCAIASWIKTSHTMAGTSKRNSAELFFAPWKDNMEPYQAYFSTTFSTTQLIFEYG